MGLIVVLFGVLAPVNANAAVKSKLIDFWDDREPRSLIDVDHSAFAEILNTYVSINEGDGTPRFDYKAVSEADIAKLGEYLNYLQLLEPRQLTDPEAKAYWINLYNAATLNMVIEAVQDRNISKVQARGLPARRWRRNIVTIAQQELSLNDILNGVIRPIYKDPRVHYALFFCTLGGPDMPTEVFGGDNNDELLDRLQANYLSQGRAVRFENDELVLSEIFQSYDTDFAPDLPGLITYLKEHVPAATAERLDSDSDVRFEYDWTLNAP